MEAVEKKFLRYVAIETTSKEDTGKCPSTDIQFNLANLLVKELKEMGLSDARVDEHCYVYATVPATKGCENEKVLGLISHMDTVDVVPGCNIKPRQFVYEGGDIVLNEKENIVMKVKDFPALNTLKGDEMIVTDGLTLLGADDKAGVAEIMAAAEYLMSHPEVKHGKVMIGFTPDEEIGAGADLFDVKGFGADYAYTVDGGDISEMEYENFNAAGAVVEVKGLSIHPGSAKDKMKNAIRMAMEFNSMLPQRQIPENTEGYEGFFHLNDIQGTEDRCVMKYIIRDHDMDKFTEKKVRMQKITDYLNDKYGDGSFKLTVKDSYFNMKSEIEKCPWVVERAENALRACGLHPAAIAIRGGTDGARLSFMGLPCPNLGTGGGNCHGIFEYVSVTQMRKMVEVLCKLAEAKA